MCFVVSDIGGLKGSRSMSVREIVAMFLYVLSHHKKNRSIGTYFIRSEKTVSRYFNLCLKAILKLHNQLLKKPTPIADDCPSNKWKCFKVHNANLTNLIGIFYQMDKFLSFFNFSFVELFRSTRWYLYKCVSAK